MGKSGIYIALGFELAILVVVMIYLGDWVDKRLGWQGIGTALGACVAMGSWIYHLLWAIQKFEKDSEGSSGND